MLGAQLRLRYRHLYGRAKYPLFLKPLGAADADDLEIALLVQPEQKDAAAGAVGEGGQRLVEVLGRTALKFSRRKLCRGSRFFIESALARRRGRRSAWPP
jgi:hypothetical protein